MPIGAELLNPIPGPDPVGANLRYDPAYDKIKEARREDDTSAPQGEWAHELKKADWPLVIKLCTDLLSNKTKDLQLAAWLTEALVRREGSNFATDWSVNSGSISFPSRRMEPMKSGLCLWSGSATVSAKD
jgi:hypothetical protein